MVSHHWYGEAVLDLTLTDSDLLLTYGPTYAVGMKEMAEVSLLSGYGLSSGRSGCLIFGMTCQDRDDLKKACSFLSER